MTDPSHGLAPKISEASAKAEATQITNEIMSQATANQTQTAGSAAPERSNGIELERATRKASATSNTTETIEITDKATTSETADQAASEASHPTETEEGSESEHRTGIEQLIDRPAVSDASNKTEIADKDATGETADNAAQSDASNRTETEDAADTEGQSYRTDSRQVTGGAAAAQPPNRTESERIAGEADARDRSQAAGSDPVNQTETSSRPEVVRPLAGGTKEPSRWAYADLDAPWLTDPCYYGDDDAPDDSQHSGDEEEPDPDDRYRYDERYRDHSWDDSSSDYGRSPKSSPSPVSGKDPPATPERTTDDWSSHYRHVGSSEEAAQEDPPPVTAIPLPTPLSRWKRA
jgi:hypothetical protein